ncbi:E3 ubiquitin-protein ligase [Dirofilaria immitis]
MAESQLLQKLKLNVNICAQSHAMNEMLRNGSKFEKIGASSLLASYGLHFINCNYVKDLFTDESHQKLGGGPYKECLKYDAFVCALNETSHDSFVNPKLPRYIKASRLGIRYGILAVFKSSLYTQLNTYFILAGFHPANQQKDQLIREFKKNSSKC